MNHTIYLELKGYNIFEFYGDIYEINFQHIPIGGCGDDLEYNNGAFMNNQYYEDYLYCNFASVGIEGTYLHNLFVCESYA